MRSVSLCRVVDSPCYVRWLFGNDNQMFLSGEASFRLIVIKERFSDVCSLNH